MTVESVHLRQPAGHKAACALCRTRTPDEVRALHDQVTADLASGRAAPMNPRQVIEAMRAVREQGNKGHQPMSQDAGKGGHKTRTVPIQSWIRRLTEQLPGWHPWFSSSPARGWYAVPAPDEASHASALELPCRIGPYRYPEELRDDALQRYGWYDDCQSCGIPARKCGHRQPEDRDE